VIRWICIHIHVSRNPHGGIHNLTGATPGRASPDARHTPPRTVGLSAGVPYFAAMRGRPKSPRDCGLAVLLALQCVPDRPCLSHGESRHTDRSRWPALCGRPDEYFDAVAHAVAGHLTQSSSAGLWLVSQPLELGHPGWHAPGQTRHRGLGGNRAPLAPRDRLGLETRYTGGQR